MKITKFIIPLVLGLAGGLIAYFIADNFGSKTIQIYPATPNCRSGRCASCRS